MGQYKMKHQGVPALMKALVGDQHKLPEHLKEAIKAAPAKKTECPPGWSAEKCAKAKAGVKAKKDAKAAQTAADAGKKQRISKNLDKAYKEGKVSKNGKRYR